MKNQFQTFMIDENGKEWIRENGEYKGAGGFWTRVKSEDSSSQSLDSELIDKNGKPVDFTRIPPMASIYVTDDRLVYICSNGDFRPIEEEDLLPPTPVDINGNPADLSRINPFLSTYVADDGLVFIEDHEGYRGAGATFRPLEESDYLQTKEKSEEVRNPFESFNRKVEKDGQISLQDTKTGRKTLIQSLGKTEEPSELNPFQGMAYINNILYTKKHFDGYSAAGGELVREDSQQNNKQEEPIKKVRFKV